LIADDIIRLDLKGLKCPLPVMKARRLLQAATAGTRLFLEATDPMAAIDVPHMCQEDGHVLLDSRRDGRVLVFLIEAGGGNQPKLPEKPEI
jgi:tRNA 2-thiouridine synthesizing protein A